MFSKLNINAIDLVRKTSPLYKKFNKHNYPNDKILFELSNNPSYIERPILLKDNVGIIVRPYDKIYNFLDISR